MRVFTFLIDKRMYVRVEDSCTSTPEYVYDRVRACVQEHIRTCAPVSVNVPALRGQGWRELPHLRMHACVRHIGGRLVPSRPRMIVRLAYMYSRRVCSH